MKVATLVVAAAAVLVTGIAGANAASVRPVEKRLDAQAAKIEQGRRDGSITWTEGIKLRKQQKLVKGIKNDFLADGHLSKRESHVLKKVQRRTAWNIVGEKTDARRRVWWLPRVGR